MEFVRMKNGKKLCYAKIVRINFGTFSGKYEIQTKLLHEKGFSTNINLPIFDTEEKAIKYFGVMKDWYRVKEAA